MAISAASVTTGVWSGTGTTQVTAAFNVTSGNDYYLAIVTAEEDGTNAAPIITSITTANNVIWSQVGSVCVVDANVTWNNSTLVVFKGTCTGSVTGATFTANVTIAGTIPAYAYSVIEVTGTNSFVQSSKVQSNTATPITGTLSAYGQSSNLPLIFCGSTGQTQQTMTPEAGWTGLNSNTFTANNFVMVATAWNSTTQDTTPSMTHSTGVQSFGIISIELGSPAPIVTGAVPRYAVKKRKRKTKTYDFSGQGWFSSDIITSGLFDKDLVVLAGGGGTNINATGQSATVSKGSIVNNVTIPITGLAITSSQGVTGVGLGVSGQQATTSQGATTPNITAALTGQQAVVAQGLAVANVANVATGQQATASQGTAILNTSVAATGQAANTALGAVASNATITVAGQLATSSQGTTTPIIINAATGQQATASQGSVVGNIDNAATGQQIATAEGTVTVTGSGTTVNATGQSASLAIGQVTVVISAPATGQSATTAQGAATGSVSLSAVGQQSAALQGNATASISTSATGQQLTSAEGTVSVSSGSVNVNATGQSAAT